jgi:hypothetical protein
MKSAESTLRTSAASESSLGGCLPTSRSSCRSAQATRPSQNPDQGARVGHSVRGQLAALDQLLPRDAVAVGTPDEAHARVVLSQQTLDLGTTIEATAHGRIHPLTAGHSCRNPRVGPGTFASRLSRPRDHIIEPSLTGLTVKFSHPRVCVQQHLAAWTSQAVHADRQHGTRIVGGRKLGEPRDAEEPVPCRLPGIGKPPAGSPAQPTSACDEVRR